MLARATLIEVASLTRAHIHAVAKETNPAEVVSRWAVVYPGLFGVSYYLWRLASDAMSWMPQQSLALAAIAPMVVMAAMGVRHFRATRPRMARSTVARRGERVYAGFALAVTAPALALGVYIAATGLPVEAKLFFLWTNVQMVMAGLTVCATYAASWLARPKAATERSPIVDVHGNPLR